MQFTGTIIPCPLCNSDRHREVARRGRDGKSLRSVICADCGLVFTNPMPTLTELSDYYGRRYRAQYKGTMEPKLKHILRSARRAIPRLERLRALDVEGGRSLDVGSGGGEFVYLLRKAGFDARGLEPNEGYGQFSRSAYGLAVDIGTIETAEHTVSSFDVITAHHVVEHLRDPVAALEKLAGWLCDDGVLVVEVPNIEANYHAPGSRFHFAHVVHFSPETLARAGEKAGLRVLSSELTRTEQHVNIAFGKAPSEPSPRVKNTAHAQQVESQLARHTRLSHFATAHPYRRLMGNLARPLKERLALPPTSSPSEILEAVYKSHTDTS